MNWNRFTGRLVLKRYNDRGVNRFSIGQILMARSTTKTRSKRVRKTKYESVLELPNLSYEEFSALKDSIAVNGVLVPIIVDSDGPIRKIIDGNYRKQIAEELGYDCPEIVQPDLEDDEKRTLARCLNLARRHFTNEQKRELISDQLFETPERSNRWVAKQLGVHHATVAKTRGELQATGQLSSLDRTVGTDGKYRPATRQLKPVDRSVAERKARIAATTLIHGDCVRKLRDIKSNSVDVVLSDPPYPEIGRDYGRMSESDWHEMMQKVVLECKRVLKPTGSAVFILQPNYEKVGKMRLWLWEFLLWSAKEWNLVQDVHWWAIDAMPTAGTNRRYGLMRQSVKMCVWLGEPNCYRKQENVLWSPSQATAARRRADIALRISPSGKHFRNSSICKAADERGGTTPFNLLPISVGGQLGGKGCHPASTPYSLAEWWCKYILPSDGVLLDCFAGSGTILQAGLDQGASSVIGIEKMKNYLTIAKKRIEQS